jgi:hypothetical protein
MWVLFSFVKRDICTLNFGKGRYFHSVDVDAGSDAAFTGLPFIAAEREGRASSSADYGMLRRPVERQSGDPP